MILDIGLRVLAVFCVFVTAVVFGGITLSLFIHGTNAIGARRWSHVVAAALMTVLAVGLGMTAVGIIIRLI